MRFVIFTHSLVSDWNHGNAHFLRGIVTELISRGHNVKVFEPEDSWSRTNLVREHGQAPLDDFQKAYPKLVSTLYNEQTLNLSEALHRVDVVLVHEWNSARLIKEIGRHRATHDYQLYFHDTHHRSLTRHADMAAYDLSQFDGVLAYGNVIRDAYLKHKWAHNAWTWHEAADTRVFRPLPSTAKDGDLVWIGNWGDNERADTLREFLIRPVKQLGLRARVYGVRYPDQALNELADANIEYGGWLPNFRVPEVFGRYRVTIHVPRGPYVQSLPGIPTIRPFEAMACGIPLISAPWIDCENLFRSGYDLLFARSGEEMISQLQRVLSEPELSTHLSSHALQTIHSRHTCAHRVEELLSIVGSPLELAFAARD